MYFIKFLSLVLSLIISITYTSSYQDEPVIAVTQGLVEHGNWLPISVLWYWPNITDIGSLVIHLPHKTINYMYYTEIDTQSGSFELPNLAQTIGIGPAEFCVELKYKGRSFNNNPCCKSKIQWMYDRRDIFGNLSLRDLIIPGTHQSAAYVSSDDELLSNGSSSSPWIPCQTEPIETQLRSGIRYLDLRPSYISINGTEEYVILHDGFNVILMETVVKIINDFLDSSKDILVVSFKEFARGFESNEAHSDFVGYLEFSFQRHTHRRAAWTETLDQFWAADKRLILCYDHDMYIASHYMWTPILLYSYDVQTINQLHLDLNALHHDHANDVIPYAALVGFTHFRTTDEEDPLQMDIKSRYWAERLSKYILEWCARDWHSLANILLVDFYQTSGIVDIAIQLNEKRAKHPRYSEKLKAQT